MSRISLRWILIPALALSASLYGSAYAKGGLLNPVQYDTKVFSGYPTYVELTASLQDLASTYPDIARLYSLGQSIEQRELWALLITDNPDLDEEEPEFKYVSTPHGDEPLGTVLCMRLAELLLTTYSTDERIQDLVDDTAIWIVPLMNPDGYELGSRTNAAKVDLNRNFPSYPWELTGTVFDGLPLAYENFQPETGHIMRWTVENSFVLSANLHTGSLVVNYPYDDDGGPTGTYQAAPDDELFRYLSAQYADANPIMQALSPFLGGITNGAAWYVIDGGMQDWNYRYASCFEVTLELNLGKAPLATDFDILWDANRESMLRYMEAAHIGVRGRITDAETGLPVYTQVFVAGNTQPVYSDPDVGDYYRMLLPGDYDLTFTAPGYTSTTKSVQVTEGVVTEVDVALATGDSPAEEAQCPAEIAFKDAPRALQALRTFRDDVLNKTLTGRRLTAMYYTHAPDLSRWVAAAPERQNAFRTVALPFTQAAR